MKRKEIAMMLAGAAIGVALSPMAAHAAEELLTAKPSSQVFYLDGRQVQMEAYDIADHNYVKLRDIGRMVGFNVSWRAEDNAVLIETDEPYSDESATHPAANQTADYAAEANPDVFTDTLTREVYDAIRGAVVHMGDDSYVRTAIPDTDSSYAAMDTVTAAMGNHPIYQPKRSADGLYCEASYSEAYEEAIAHTQGFLDSIADMSERDKVEQIAWYVCDRLDYRTSITSPTKVLSQDGVLEGNCMSYAHSFIFMCGRAGISCLLQHSETHQWNKVYVDGQWWDVDLTATDAITHTAAQVLFEDGELQGIHYKNSAPEVTAFIQELLVPGSTK